MFFRIKKFVFTVLCFLLLGFLSSNNTYADIYTSSITTSGDITMNLSAAVGASVATDTVTINSTCPLGYNVGIAGPSDSALYKDGNSASSAINPSIGTIDSKAPIKGDSYLNTWGYSIDSDTTVNSSSFIGLTNEIATIFTKNSASNNTGDQLAIHYGVSVSPTQEPGAYRLTNDGVITYYLTADPSCSNFEIAYNGNNDDGDTAMNIRHSSVTENDTVTLYASNYKRSGYGFAGWSTIQLNPESSTFQNDLIVARADGKVFGPNETVTANSDFLNQATNVDGRIVVTLYAIWVKPTGTLQNWFCPDDTTMPIDSVTALTDSRDNNVYAVAKLADGNCWMIENLRLSSKDGSNNYINLSAADTNKPQLPLINVNGGTSNHLSDSSNLASSPWCTDYDQNCIEKSMLNTYNTANAVASMTRTNSNIYSYGNYYNWYSATAGNGVYTVDSEETVSGDICPIGWHLPTGSSGGEFHVLNTSVNSGLTNTSAGFRKYPANFIYSGLINSASIYERGTDSRYWSSTAYDNDIAYYLNLDNTSSGYGQNTEGRYDGLSVRCLTPPPREVAVTFDSNISSVTLMSPDSTSQTINTSGQIITLRNKVEYTVSATLASGYKINAWATTATGTLNNTTGNPVTYTVTGDATLSVTARLPYTIANAYANAGKTQLSGYYKMQDMNSSICNTVEVENDELQVIDTRDNKIYWIAKLKDGHCWMTQNLDLDLEATPTNVATLTSENTDLNEYGVNGYTSTNGYSCSNATTNCNGGIITWTPDKSTIHANASGNFSGWVNQNAQQYSANPGNWYYAGYDGQTLLPSVEVNYLANTNKVTVDGVTTVYSDAEHTVPYFRTTPFTGSGTSNNGEHGHVGNYYSWTASVASNNTSSFTTSTFDNTANNPKNSICPAGWRLPIIADFSLIATGLNDFANLNYYYNQKTATTSAGLEKAPLYFVRSGGVSGIRPYNAGYHASYWSSTLYDSDNAGYLYFYNSSAHLAHSYTRYHGDSIRCIAR